MGIRPDGQSVKGTTRVSFGDRRLMRSLFIHGKASRQERARDNRKLTKNDKDAANEMPARRARRSFAAYWKKVRTAPKRFEAAPTDNDRLATHVMTSAAWIDVVDRWRALERDRAQLAALSTCVRRVRTAVEKRSSAPSAANRDQTLDAHVEGALTAAFAKSKGGADVDYRHTAHIAATLCRSFAVQASDDDDDGHHDNGHASEQRFHWAEVDAMLSAAVRDATIRPDDVPLLHTKRNVRLVHHYGRVRAAREAYRQSTSRTCEFAQVHMGKRKRREHDAMLASSAFLSKDDTIAELSLLQNDDAHETAAVMQPAEKRRRGDSYDSRCRQWAEQTCEGDRGYEFVFVSHDGPEVALTGAAPSNLYWLEPNYFDVRGSSVIDVLREYSAVDDELRHKQRARFGVEAESPSSASTTPSPLSDRHQRQQRFLSASSDTASPSAVTLQQRQNTVDFVTAHEVERHANLWTTCHRCSEPLHTCDMVVTRGLLTHDVSCYHAQCSAEYALLQRRRHKQAHDKDPVHNMAAVPNPIVGHVVPSKKRKRAVRTTTAAAAGAKRKVTSAPSNESEGTVSLLSRLERQMLAFSDTRH